MAETPERPGLQTGNVPSPTPVPAPISEGFPGAPGAAQAIGYGTSWKDFRELGTSGLRAFAGYVREDFLPNLQGRQAARTYREMGDNSPVIGGILYAIQSAMRKVQWRVQAPEDGPENQEKIDYVNSCMDDMSMTWEDVVTDALSMLQFGYAPLEIVYKRRLGRQPGMEDGRELPSSAYDDGLIGWRRLPVRGQDTVLKWFFDENGVVTGLTQQPYIGWLVDVPIERMLLFRTTAYKQNPEGRAILRNAYVPYSFVKRLQEQEAITYERLGGFPVARLPSALLDAAASGDGPSLQVLNNMKKIVTNIRIDEQMGLVLPSDTYLSADGSPSAIYKYDLDFKIPQGGRSSMSPNETINRHSVNMMVSVLADWLQMGHEKTGTQGLSTNKVDMFFLAVEGYLNSMAAVFNRYALPRLWRLNGWDEVDMPVIVPDLAQRIDLDVLSNYVLRLSQSGMPLFPNEELQSYLADAAGLPDIQDPMAMEAAGLTDELIAHQTDQTLNPPEPPPGTPPGLAKMLRASLARRIGRMQGPKFGVRTGTRKRHGHRKRADRIKAFTRG